MQKAEDDCYRYADAVVSMLPKAEEHMREHGLTRDKFHYVPNGIVLSDWNNPKGIPEEHGLFQPECSVWNLSDRIFIVFYRMLANQYACKISGKKMEVIFLGTDIVIYRTFEKKL